MLRVNPIQTNFSSGELSPQLLGRTDIERYFGGAETLENVVVRPSGGAERRLGSRNVDRAVTQDPNKTVRLVDFVFSRSEAVVIEISAGKFRFVVNGILQLVTDVPYHVDRIYGTSDPIPYTDADINELQFTQSGDVLFITHPDHRPAILSRYGPIDWRYQIPDFDYGPYLDQEPGDQNFSLTVGNVVDRATLTSTTSDFTTLVLNDLVEYPFQGTWVLGRVINVIDPNTVEIEPLEDRSLSFSREVYSPGIYEGWDATNSIPTYNTTISGAGVTVAFSNTGVLTQEHVGNYVRFVDSTGTYHWMYVTGIGDIVRMGSYGILATGNILNVLVPAGIVTRSDRTILADMYASDSTFFDLSIDQDRLWRLVLGGQVVHARSYAHAANSGFLLKVQLNRPLPRSREGAAIVDDGTTNDWNCGAWFPGNYPATVFFHEERLGFAGTYYEPQTGWLSKTADFFNFAATDDKLRVLDDSAITFTVASDTVNQVLWGVSKRSLIIGTAGGEWNVSASGGSETALSATNAMVQTQSSYGSEFVRPVLVGKSLLYLQRAGRKLRKMEYDYQADTLASLDLTLFSEHIMKEHGGAWQLAYQLLPESVLYARLGDGQIGVLCYEEDQQVYAWSRYRLGGGGFVESIASIPEGDKYRLYCVVRRTVNGSTVRTIEYIDPEFRPSSPTDRSTMRFLDCHRAGGSGSASLTGLADYAGQTLEAVIDGIPSGTIAVSTGGTATLPRVPTSSYVIGYPYASVIKTLPIEAQAPAGTGQGKIKRINHLTVRLLNSHSFKHGMTLDTLRAESVTGPAFLSDDVRFPTNDGFTMRGQYYLVQDQPLPLTVLSIMPELATYQ